MTIDSAWVARLKADAPHCFCSRRPFVPECVFIDGQIKLMSGAPEATRTWDDYIRAQFERVILAHYRGGARVVVLAFDNYAHVPVAKSMTQGARRSRVQPIEFHERDELPPVLPRGDYWARCIASRSFKGKVIELVIASVARNVLLQPGQELIIDYHGAPVRHTPDREPELLHGGLAPLGEADVKFARYAREYSLVQIDSVDGDSIPLAMLHLEAARGPPDQQISILRLETRVKPPPQARGRKRARVDAAPARRVDAAPARPTVVSRFFPQPADADADADADAGADADADADGAKKKKRRTYEYVLARPLYDFVRAELALGARTHGALPDDHAAAVLAALVALTGTDYTRGLPQVGADFVYDARHELVPALARAYDPRTRSLDPERMIDGVVATLYAWKFAKHVARLPPVGGAPGALEAVLASVADSKLADRTRASMPSRAFLRVGVRNTNWLLAYWCDADRPPPDPIDPLRFGFARTSDGAPCYDSGRA